MIGVIIVGMSLIQVTDKFFKPGQNIELYFDSPNSPLESAVWCFCLLLDGDSEELSRRAENEHRIDNCNPDVLIGR